MIRYNNKEKDVWYIAQKQFIQHGLPNGYAQKVEKKYNFIYTKQKKLIFSLPNIFFPLCRASQKMYKNNSTHDFFVIIINII